VNTYQEVVMSRRLSDRKLCELQAQAHQVGADVIECLIVEVRNLRRRAVQERRRRRRGEVQRVHG
jgi:hypothetical protein